MIDMRGQSGLYVKAILISGLQPAMEQIRTTQKLVANETSLVNNKQCLTKSELIVMMMMTQQPKLSFGVGNFRLMRGMET